MVLIPDYGSVRACSSPMMIIMTAVRDCVIVLLSVRMCSPKELSSRGLYSGVVNHAACAAWLSDAVRGATQDQASNSLFPREGLSPTPSSLTRLRRGYFGERIFSSCELIVALTPPLESLSQNMPRNMREDGPMFDLCLVFTSSLSRISSSRKPQ